jgi:hypothetical protein
MKSLVLSLIILLSLIAANESVPAAQAEGRYTLPFDDPWTLTCGFGCYGGHNGGPRVTL